MAEEFDKSEDATPFRLEEARKKGQVAKSQEFNSFLSVSATIIGFAVSLSYLGDMVLNYFKFWISNANVYAGDSAIALINGQQMLSAIITAVLILVLLGAAVSIIGTYINVGGVFSVFPLKPDLSKLNPAKGLKKIFSRRAVVDIVRLALKLILFCLVAYFIIKSHFSTIFSMVFLEQGQVISSWIRLVGVLIAGLLFVFFIFSLFDLWYSRREFARQMRMSRRDIKDEYKRREGNPEVKQKRKKDQQELLKKFSGLAHVNDSDVIITNPTHVAVALKYRSKSMVLPQVIVKGKGTFARVIKLKASRCGIPIIESPIIARKLERACKIGNPINLEHQKEVAEVYKQIIGMPGCKVFNDD